MILCLLTLDSLDIIVFHDLQWILMRSCKPKRCKYELKLKFCFLWELVLSHGIDCFIIFLLLLLLLFFLFFLGSEQGEMNHYLFLAKIKKI